MKIVGESGVKVADRDKEVLVEMRDVVRGKERKQEKKINRRCSRQRMQRWIGGEGDGWRDTGRRIEV